MLFCEAPEIRMSDLPPEVAPPAAVAAAVAAAAAAGPTPVPIVDGALSPSTTASGSFPPPSATTTPAGGSLKEAVRAETERVERGLIQKALDETGGNVTQAARKLKISRKSLQTKMKEFGLRDQSSKEG